MRESLVLIVILVFACGSRAVAQSVPPLELSVEKAVRTALAGNHELAAARYEVERADALVSEAWGTALPKIDFNARYQRAIKKPVFFLPDFLNPASGRVTAIEIGATHSIDMTFSAEQTLFDAAVFVGVGAARIYARAARETYRAKEIEIATNARKAFYGVLVSKEVVDLATENLKYAEENFSNVRLLAAQGLVAEYDQLRAEVTLENLRPEVINAENSYRLALNGLKAALGVPYAQEVLLVGSLGYRPVPDSLIEMAQEAMLRQNASLSALRHQIEVNDAIVTAQRSYYLPVLSAFGNYQYTTQKNTFDFSTSDLIQSSVVGLSLRLNIFNGMQTTARVEQAQLEFRKTQEQLAGLELNLHAATEAAVLRLTKARQRIESQGRTVDQARRGFEIATTRYTDGSGTQLEVSDAQLALARAKVNRIEAVFEYATAAADLDQLLGRIPEFPRTEKEN